VDGSCSASCAKLVAVECRATSAKLRHLAAVEDVDYHTPRGLDRAAFLKLAGCDWIRERRHCLLTGPAGVGKSWLACALGYKACRENLSVLYQRVPRLFAALALARGDGRYAKLLKQLARVDLLILDDWGPEPLLPEQQRDLLETVEDRYDAGSLIVTSRVPIDRWYEIVGNPTLAGRRHPGPHPAQRAPDRAQGRKPAQAAGRRMKPLPHAPASMNAWPPIAMRYVCARRSWRGPAGGRPVQVRGSARLVASVALRKVTTAAKRTQRLCGVGY